MSGMRDHKIFTVTIEGEQIYYDQDQYGDNYGPKKEHPRTHKLTIIAPMPEIALAHTNCWAPFFDWVMDPPPKISIDAGVSPDVVILEQVW